MGEDVGPEELLEAHKYECTANLVRWTDGGEMGGCSNFGLLHDDGTGVGQDAAKAAALYQKACVEDDCIREVEILPSYAAAAAPCSSQSRGRGRLCYDDRCGCKCRGE